MDPFLIIVVVALGLFVFMQFRTAKKRRNEAAELHEKMLPGSEIMTNYGLYGTIVSIDEDTNVALIETTPGTVLRIHRQTILKVVEDDVVVDETEEATEDDAVIETPTEDAIAPEFGERVNEEPAKPARKSAKKDRE
ncbi:MAG TPA: preprotein translocase subunit YajC [Homoserinimonas sp.]|nr:preprotein translocase subunit YajC [Homoserinimonas sp.]